MKLRMDVSDPATLRAMVKDMLTTAGLDREQINQVRRGLGEGVD